MLLPAHVDYEQIAVLAEQLSPEQQNALIGRLLLHQARQRSLTVEEKIQLLDATKHHHPVRHEPSPRREDWYGDDGR